MNNASAEVIYMYAYQLLSTASTHLMNGGVNKKDVLKQKEDHNKKNS